ncbi:ROK family protein [Novosphingobium aerophilum]|uniref:ROK family protein n=1 Tax=Novosphingobium TaxID=165696 RepID=UPI0006C8D3D3|nr:MULTISPECIES: ROK family protein [unclassified Novosphingobium]MPS70459.1 ROK family protein [Novosphingobium sp.]TCM34368.1 fructokinase [Novosphingobium sp. ST904]WRT96009.1 ROK family protein [Novosphingobium sp. RL4]
MLFAAIEAGGTKFVCGIGSSKGSLRTEVIPTTDPAETLSRVEAFLDAAIAEFGPIAAIGIGSFGPLDLDPASPGHGRILATPKPGWEGTDMPARLRARFGVPVGIDTDVNAAAFAEMRLHGVDNLAYVTVGTGIGAGIVVQGRTMRGLGHPECGHIAVARHPAHADFAGICPYHGDCLEGMASGPALQAAWGASASHLPEDHPAWDAQADYLGQLCVTLILTVAPQRIVLGGGVMNRPFLLERVRAATLRRLNGYCVQWDAAKANEALLPPRSPEAPGLVGSYLIAEAASEQ